LKSWIDGSSSNNNVIVANRISLLVASCEKDQADSIRQELNDGKSPAEVLGTDGVKVIPFNRIQTLVSRHTDVNVDIDYKAARKVESLSIDFENEEFAEEFIDFINPHIPENLELKVSQQHRLVAIIAPVFGIAFFFLLAFVYWNKFRLPIYAVGAVWIALGLYMLYTRLTNPPVITRWKLKGKKIRKAWNGLKNVTSGAVAVAVVCGFSLKLPDSHGERAVYDRVYHEMATAEDIQGLIENGGDLYYEDWEGDTALALAIMWNETDLAMGILDADYDITATEGDQALLELALWNDEFSVADRLISMGAIETARLQGFDPTEYLNDYDNGEIRALLEKHQLVAEVTDEL